MNLDMRVKHCEIVIPDGRFARCRPITVEDFLMVTCTGLTPAAVATLVARCVTFDDCAVTIPQVLAMELASYMPVAAMVVRQFNAAICSREVA